MGDTAPTSEAGALRVFLSYARADATPLVTRLVDDLSRAHILPWLDNAEMAGGIVWTRQIEQAIDDAGALVALLSRASYLSNICRAEHMRALRLGKRVIPVLVHTAADRPLHLEHLQYVDFTNPDGYPDALRELLASIRSSDPVRALPLAIAQTRVTAPPPPAAVVDRPADVAAVRELLLGEADERSIPVVGVRGMGGVGKTVVAQLVCRDAIVQAAYPDGIVWVGIGRHPGDLVAQLRAAGTALGDDASFYTTPELSSVRLRSVLQRRSVLLVLDDVWDARHVEPFRSAVPRCRILFTTREASVAIALGAREHLVRPDRKQGLAILARWAARDEAGLPPEAAGLVRQTGGLPLALAMLGAMLRRNPHRWTSILDNVRAARLEAIQQPFPSYPYPNLAAALQVSVEALDPQLQARYLDLAAFPEDRPIPEDALTLLWNCPLQSAQATVDTFFDSSLAQSDGPGLLTLHDLLHDYVRSRVAGAQLAAVRDRVVEGYRLRAAGAWPSGPDDAYFYSFLPFHLAESGRRSELRELLLNAEWLEAKLQATDVAALIGDYSAFPDDSALDRIRRALRLSAHVLANHKSQLRSQLWGRLPERAGLRFRSGAPWLKALTPGLTQAGGSLLLTFAGHEQRVGAVAITPDGVHAVTGSADGVCKIWEIDTGAVVRTFSAHSKEVQWIAVSPDGSLILTAGEENAIRIWEFATGRLVQEHSGWLMAGSPDFTRLAVAPDRFGKTVVIQTLSIPATPLRTLTFDTHVVSAAFSPAADRLLVSTWPKGASRRDEQTVHLWDLLSGQLVQAFQAGSPAGSLRFLSDGERMIASGGTLDPARIWRVSSGLPEVELELPLSGSGPLAVTSGDRHVVATDHGSLLLLSVETGRKVRAFDGHTDWVSAAAVSKDGGRMVSVSSDKTARVWDLESAHGSDTPSPHSAKVSAVAVARDAGVCFTASHDGYVKRWRLPDLIEVAPPIAVGDTALSLDVTSDSRCALVGSADGTAQHFDISTGQALLMIPHPLRWLMNVDDVTTSVDAVALSPDGRFAVTAFVSDKPSIRVTDLRAPGVKQYRAQSVREEPFHVHAIAFFPDSRRVALACGDGVCRIWDIVSGDVVRTLPGHRRDVDAVAVNASHNRILTGSRDGTAILWRASDGDRLSTLEHDAPVHAVALSDDGRWALTGFGRGLNEMFEPGANLGGCTLWDLERGAAHATFFGESSVECCAFLDGPGLLVAGERSGRVHFLKLEER